MRTQTKQDKPRIALMLTKWKPEQYDTESSTYKLSIVRIDPSDDKPRNCSRTSNWDAPGTAIFDDLEISCWMRWNANDQSFDATQFSVNYSGYMHLELAELETMAKGLRRARKISSGFPVTPATFGQFACMMAAGFGVKECIRVRGDDSSWSYADSDWQILPLSSAQRLIDEELTRIRAAVLPDAATVAA